jgi:predicted ABC-type ATPase
MRMEARPHVIVLAGPNGAGKTTAAARLLAGELHVEEYVNADVIARGLSGFNPDKAAFQAGRIMLERVRELANQRIDFAFETTLASKTFAPWIGRLRQTGYDFILLYLWVPSPEMSIERVADRVRKGGHHVPAETVERRYYGGLRNFFQLYRPLADEWRLYDNSQPDAPRLVAAGVGAETAHVSDSAAWQRIREMIDHAPQRQDD